MTPHPPNTPRRLGLARAVCSRGVPGWTLAEFFVEAWRILEPSTPLVPGWHLWAICDHVQAQLEGGRFGNRWAQNLTIQVPPGSAKSTILSVCAPAWRWTWDPAWRVLCISGNPDVATRDSLACRRLIESDWYRETFRPPWKLATDQNVKTYFQTSAGGFRQAKGMQADVTGDRPHAIILDDPLDAQDAPSRARREAVNYAWDHGIANRIADPQRGSRTLIMQRLHEDDLAGHVLAEGCWSHLRIPMEFDAKPSCRCPDCASGETFMGWRDPRKLDGELMCPERFPERSLAQERRRLGPSGYAAQMQQRPAPASGAMFDRDNFRAITQMPVSPAARIRSWDLAASKDGDWTVGVRMSLGADGRVCVEDVVRFRATPGEVERRMRATAEADGKATRIRIPLDPGQAGVSQSQALIRLLAGFNVVADRETGDKAVRASPFAAQVEGGNVDILVGTEWLPEFLAEMDSFPRGRWDDQVDASAAAYAMLVADPHARTRSLLTMRIR